MRHACTGLGQPVSDPGRVLNLLLEPAVELGLGGGELRKPVGEVLANDVDDEEVALRLLLEGSHFLGDARAHRSLVPVARLTCHVVGALGRPAAPVPSRFTRRSPLPFSPLDARSRHSPRRSVALVPARPSAAARH